MKFKFLSLTVAVAGCMVILPAHALTADGLTYTLSAFATPTPAVADFDLTISGINGPSDTEGGRYGVFAIAINDPSGFATITGIPAGFELMPGGLSSGSGGGCEGNGNFICVQNTQPITQSSLAADSTLSFNFLVNISGISTPAAADYQDDFKISWDGGKSTGYQYNPGDPADAGDFKSGYDHVSRSLLQPAAAPEIDPANATAALTFLAGGLALLRGRRRSS